MGEEQRLSLPSNDQFRPSRHGSLAESFELLHGPSDDVLVDALCEEAQLGAVEGSVVVDPAPDLGPRQSPTGFEPA